MIELKPCPFCGGEAVTEFDSDWGMVVRCARDCGAMTVERRYPLATDPVEAWNTRAERTCQRVLYKLTGVLVCSECGAGIPTQLDKYCYLHFCPNCGAKVVE